MRFQIEILKMHNDTKWKPYKSDETMYRNPNTLN